MEYLENDFAQIEHVNQVILNNTSHDTWDCFDTFELLKQFPFLGHYTGVRDSSYLNIGDGAVNVRGKTVKRHSQIRYNSFIVTIELIWIDNEKWYRYTFEVRNSLWTGEYILRKAIRKSGADENDETQEAYEEFAENDVIVSVGEDGDTSSTASSNTLIIEVRGNHLNYIRVCFRMAMAGATRNILVTNLQLMLNGGEEYRHQYDTTNYEKGDVSLNNGNTANNVTVSIKPCDKKGRAITYGNDIGPYIPAKTLTGVKGEFNMPYGPTSVPGDYYCLMEATSNRNNIKAAVQKLIHVQKVQDEKITIEWEKEYKNVYKGCKYRYKLYFGLESELGTESSNKDKMIGTPVNITFIHTGGKREPYSSTIQKDEENDKYYAEVLISYRGYYDDHSYLEVEISSEYNFGRLMSQKIIKHPWFIASNYNDILGQMVLLNESGNYVDTNGNVVTNPVPNDLGTDWIFLENKTFNVSKTLVLDRDVTIASVSGTSHSVFDGQNRNIIKTKPLDQSSKNMLKVNLVGLAFKNAECAIYSQAGTRLLVERCYFTNNKNDNQHHKGCSIYLPDDDYSTKHNDLWKTEIRNSYFYNNKGNEIQSVGSTRIMGCLFVTDNAQYLQQPEVKVVSVRSGSVTYTDNKSYINTGRKPMASNHSYAKALAYVEYGATFNGKGPNKLGGDLTLPLYGHPYNNQAYTYAIYYYPYSNVKTEIVCSPRRGYERKATGHGSSFKNWVYYDGYYFLRWERGRNTGNLHDPWTKEELAMPKNLGIFDKVKEKFIEDYDPRFSGAKCTVSTFDKS